MSDPGGVQKSLVTLAKDRHETDHIVDLLKQGVDPDGKDHQGMTALHWAGKTGNEVLVRALLDAKADIHATDIHQNTPLFYAVLKRSPPNIKLLLDAGAKADTARHNGTTPLHIAARHNYAEVVKLLVTCGCGAECNARTSAGETPLHLAVDSGSKELVNCLIEAGADAGARLPNGDTALHLLATAIVRNRNPANLDSRIDIMVELLQSYDACDSVNDQGETPLDIIGDEFTRSHSLDLCIIVKSFLAMKLKQSERTFANIIEGIIYRNKHYSNTFPIMLPYLDPKLLVVRSVKPLSIRLGTSATLSFFYRPPAVSSSRKQKYGTPGQLNRAEQFLRLSRMMCEVGCTPPTAENIEGLPEVTDATDSDITDAEKEYIMEAVSVWKGYAETGPSLQTIARNSVRRYMVNIQQQTFSRLPVPPRITDYLSMSELKNLEY